MRTANPTKLARWLIAAALIVAGPMLFSAGSRGGVSPANATPAVDTTTNASGTTNYANRARWLSLDTTGTAPVDIFYFYPTSYTATGTDPVICAVDNPQMLAGAAVAFARQATAFEPVGNIYAPYYRQADAGLRATMPQSEQVQVVGGAPTRDAIAAFDYYITHYNHGRPFILAGHSLGSNVTANLLAQYMGRNPAVRKRMIAAYVIGYSITPSYLAKSPFLTFANGANDTGVIVSWNTEGPVLYGINPVTLPGGIAINPISWTRGEATATAEQNLGSELLDALSTPSGKPIYNPDGSIKRFMNLCDARVDIARGVVVCSSIPETLVADFTGDFPKGVYHPFDYPFYYWNIRANAAARTAHFSAPTSLARPTVSAAHPEHWKSTKFTCVLTPSSAALKGTTRLLFYHRETKTVSKKVGGEWERVRVRYWHLRATKTMRVSAGGRLSLTCKLGRSGTWNLVAKYSGVAHGASSMGYAPVTSPTKSFKAK